MIDVTENVHVLGIISISDADGFHQSPTHKPL